MYRTIDEREWRGRRGLVLVLVLVVVAMLSLAAYTFAELMLAEHKATHIEGRQLQAVAAAESGVELLKSLVDASHMADRSTARVDHDPGSTLRGVPVLADEAQPAWFSVVCTDASREVNTESRPQSPNGIAFGLENESGRLNLCVLADWDVRQRGAARRALLVLPGMTLELADSILDWIDADEVPREFGAEREYYAALDPPRAPRNAPPEAIDELLQVRGVTRRLLYGLDANHNGRIDPHEQTNSSLAQPRDVGIATHPLEDDLGWERYLTLHSAESNLDREGRPRINLNAADLPQLYQQLRSRLGDAWARFIVAYRQNGPCAESGKPSSHAGPLALSLPPRYQLASMFDLLDVRVRATLQGHRTVILESPLGVRGTPLASDLNQLLDYASLTDEPAIVGRLNVDLAPERLLAAVPGMNAELAEAIASRRGRVAGAVAERDRHATWLFAERLAPRESLRRLAPYLTGGGDVHRAQVIGISAQPGRAARIEVVIDGTRLPARTISWMDLRQLGIGYTLSELGLDDLTRGKAGEGGLDSPVSRASLRLNPAARPSS